MMMNSGATDQAQIQSMKRRSQSEIFSLETDLNRLKNQNTLAETEIKRIKDSIARLEADLGAKVSARDILVRRISQSEEEVARAKKKMSAL